MMSNEEDIVRGCVYTMIHKPWYEQSFGEDYMLVYKHRDMQGARREVEKMVKWLDLPKGSDILDLCCGMGRHSLALADQGYQVTGLDLSTILLDEAMNLDTDDRVNWIQGDMREVPLQREFDAVVNLFTSFGYFAEDEENIRVLGEISRLLKPNGKFIIDYLNPVYVENHLVSFSQKKQDDILISEYRSIQDGFVRKKIVIEQENQSNREYLEQVKLYSHQQFTGLIERTNLTVSHLFGDYNGNPYEESQSPRMIFVGYKERKM